MTLLLALLLTVALPDTAASPDPLRAAAEAALAARFPDAAGRLQVRVLRTADDAAFEAPLRVRFRALDAVPRAHAQVDVLAADGAGRWTEAGWALLFVAHYDSVVVPSARVTRDAPLTGGDWSTAWLETTRFRGEPLAPAALRAMAADGPVYATRSLAADRPLRAADVRPAYAADTGAAVRMRYERAGLALTLSCKAREPGFVGDAVRLYAPDTRTTYRARLVAPGEAEWIETL